LAEKNKLGDSSYWVQVARNSSVAEQT